MPLLVTPKPHQGESLPSLLGRLAACNRMPLRELLNRLGLAATATVIDEILHPTPQLLAGVATLSGYSEDQLRGHTAERWKNFADLHPLLVTSRYLGARHESLIWRRHLPFCPACLSQHPSVRLLDWHLGFLPVCDEHQLLLQNRCQHCATPLPLEALATSIDPCCRQCRRTLLGEEGLSVQEIDGLPAAAAALRQELRIQAISQTRLVAFFDALSLMGGKRLTSVTAHTNLTLDLARWHMPMLAGIIGPRVRTLLPTAWELASGGPYAMDLAARIAAESQPGPDSLFTGRRLLRGRTLLNIRPSAETAAERAAAIAHSVDFQDLVTEAFGPFPAQEPGWRPILMTWLQSSEASLPARHHLHSTLILQLVERLEALGRLEQLDACIRSASNVVEQIGPDMVERSA